MGSAPEDASGFSSKQFRARSTASRQSYESHSDDQEQRDQKNQQHSYQREGESNVECEGTVDQLELHAPLLAENLSSRVAVWLYTVYASMRCMNVCSLRLFTTNH